MANNSDDIIKAMSNVGIDDMNETIVSFAGQMMKLDSCEDIEPIVSAIGNCKGLVTLSLEGNTLGITAGKELGKSLESKTSVEKLLLNNLFTGRLKTEIPEVLMFVTSGVMLSNARLHTLDLSDNAIGPVGMPSLLPFLQSPSCATLNTLRLNNCGLGIGGGQILAKGLVCLTSLQTLICGRNRLEILGAEAIGNALTKLHTLETLEMPQNGIHSEGIAAVCRAIDSNTGLKNLNLNDNNLKTETKTIAETIKKLKSIEIINFGDCILKSAGCIVICNAIVESNASNIQEIVLSGNEIGSQKAIESIIKCGQQMCGRQESKIKLDLSDNNFGTSGVELLSSALAQQMDVNISNDEGEEEEEDDDEDEERETNVTNVTNDELPVAPTDKQDTLIDELTRKIENELTDINDLCSHFVKVSVDGFDSHALKLKEEALIESEVCLKYAIGNNSDEFIAMNALLVYLGLLKDETGVYKIVDDLRGPLSALTHSIGLLTSQQKQVLRAFMNRPNKSVEKCGKIRHHLMQQLFI